MEGEPPAYTAKWSPLVENLFAVSSSNELNVYEYNPKGTDAKTLYALTATASFVVSRRDIPDRART